MKAAACLDRRDGGILWHPVIHVAPSTDGRSEIERELMLFAPMGVLTDSTF